MHEARTAPTLDPTGAADIANRIVEVASDRKASDIVLLDIERLTTLADYFVIMTGTSTVQIRALANNIKLALDSDGVRPLHVEGDSEDGWVLMDYGAVVVHVFSQEQRAYYGLELLWSGATTVVRIQ